MITKETKKAMCDVFVTYTQNKIKKICRVAQTNRHYQVIDQCKIFPIQYKQNKDLSKDLNHT